MSACLPTHILDLVNGSPESLEKVELYNSTQELLKTTHTNEDGRLLSPLLTKNEMKKVILKTILENPSFLNKVPPAFLYQ